MSNERNLWCVFVVTALALIVSYAVADFDKTKPADNRDYDLRDNDIRTNNTALETAIGNEHEFVTGGVQTGEPNEGHAKAYYESAAPTTRPDGSTALDANDAGRLWYDSDVNQISVWSGNEWERFSETRTYDVNDYGATGDGTTDDSTAFQNAINAANTAGGGLVTVPPGTYIITTALIPKSYVTVRGHGDSSILKASAANNDGIFVDTPTARVEKFALEWLTFRSVDKDVSVLENKATAYYYAYFAMRYCEIYAEFDVAVKGVFGHSVFEKCRFGYLGTPPTDWQPVSLVGQSGKNIFSNSFVDCGFYKGTATQEAMVNLETGWAQSFYNCIFEQADCPAIHAEGVLSVHLGSGCNLENLDCTNAAQNCAILLEQDAVLSMGSMVIFDHVKIQNNASTVWDALVYTPAACFAGFQNGCSGSMGSKYYTYDGATYDGELDVLFAIGNRFVASGSTAITKSFHFASTAEFTESLTLTDTGGTIRQATIIKTIDCNSADTTGDDYQFDNSQANQTEQVITLTNILPAYAELVSVQLRCFETVTGSAQMSIDFGTSSGGAEVFAAANIDSANDITGTEAGASPELQATNAARSLYLNATPNANWNTPLVQGRWAIMLTIIDYANCYGDN
jgi:hypothetical protein